MDEVSNFLPSLNVDDDNTQEQPRPNKAAGDAAEPDRPSPRARAVIAQYLKERVPEYRELAELRTKGWENPEGDKFFRNQRKRADETSKKKERYFYDLMRKLGRELHKNTGAFNIDRSPRSRSQILDMCMAPGGYLSEALHMNPGAGALAFTLPVSDGGHEVLLPKNKNVETRFLDVTMLAADMGVPQIPKEHEDADSFLPAQFDAKREFDIVLCDGQVLRTHSRAAYREAREARRLTSVQLALGLECLRQGGSMVVLLHKLESWDTVLLVRKFSRFSDIKLYKPRQGHGTRSSFYMVAKNIDTRRSEAVQAVREWKKAWRVATFGNDQEYWEVVRGDDPPVSEVLDEFGPRLIELGRPVWTVQAEALAKAPFVQRGQGKSGIGTAKTVE